MLCLYATEELDTSQAMMTDPYSFTSSEPDLFFGQNDPLSASKVLERVVTDIRAGGIDAAVNAIQGMFPKVLPNDCRLWAIYIKICDENGEIPSLYVMNSFRTTSWYEAFSVGEGAKLAVSVFLGDSNSSTDFVRAGAARCICGHGNEKWS